MEITKLREFCNGLTNLRLAEKANGDGHSMLTPSQMDSHRADLRTLALGAETEAKQILHHLRSPQAASEFEASFYRQTHQISEQMLAAIRSEGGPLKILENAPDIIPFAKKSCGIYLLGYRMRFSGRDCVHRHSCRLGQLHAELGRLSVWTYRFEELDVDDEEAGVRRLNEFVRVSNRFPRYDSSSESGRWVGRG